MYHVLPSTKYGTIARIGAVTIPNSRQFSGTFAWSASGPPTVSAWPYLFALGVVNGNDTPIRICYNGDDGKIYMLGRRISDATIIYNVELVSAANATNGSVNRIAWQVDLDNLSNCKIWNNGVETVWGAFGGDETITPEFASAVKGSVMQDLAGNQFVTTAGVFSALISFSPTLDLDPSAIYDADGYFTDPGHEFRNWYGGNQPAVAFTASPSVNQGWCRHFGGIRINHTPADDYDYENTGEHREGSAFTPSLGGKQVNEGIGY
jgi:hypothetical protein